MVVFVTAFSEFAFEGFNVHAVDFLVKPFDLLRFQQACSKAEEFIKRKIATGETPPEYVTIKSDYKYNLINISDILYVESKDDYVKFYLKDKKSILSKMTTKSTQDLLPEHTFLRIHRSFIINKTYLTSLSTSYINLSGIKLPIGKKYKDEVLHVITK
jgi:two-component system, LytTR family, response regulator